MTKTLQTPGVRFYYPSLLSTKMKLLFISLWREGAPFIVPNMLRANVQAFLPVCSVHMFQAFDFVTDLKKFKIFLILL